MKNYISRVTKGFQFPLYITKLVKIFLIFEGKATHFMIDLLNLVFDFGLLLEQHHLF